MALKKTVASSDVRGLLKLSHRLHRAPDPLARKRQMVEGLCELTDAQCGVVIVTHQSPEDSATRVVSLVEYRPRGVGTIHIPQPVMPMNSVAIAPADDIVRAAATAGAPRPSGSPVIPPPHARSGVRQRHLVSSRSLKNDFTTASIYLYRPADHEKPFTSHHRLLVELFHEQVEWVYQPDILLLSPAARSLSPRERQTLELLLSGLSEKQIAARLKLSPNTIHHYVKSLHRHFDVSSRSELLARWTGNEVVSEQDEVE